VAFIGASPLSGASPLTVTFSGADCFDPERRLTYAWAFGDGGTSTLGLVAHLYRLGQLRGRARHRRRTDHTAPASVAITVGQPALPTPVCWTISTVNRPLDGAWAGSTSPLNIVGNELCRAAASHAGLEQRRWRRPGGLVNPAH
jgi:hypothetical protein